jgi:hypothetical protein
MCHKHIRRWRDGTDVNDNIQCLSAARRGSGILCAGDDPIPKICHNGWAVTCPHCNREAGVVDLIKKIEQQKVWEMLSNGSAERDDEDKKDDKDKKPEAAT